MTPIANTIGCTDLGTFAYADDIDHYTGQSAMLGQRTSMNTITKYYYDTNYQLNRDYPNFAPFNSEVHTWTQQTTS